jgi:hypothetical protein
MLLQIGSKILKTSLWGILLGLMFYSHPVTAGEKAAAGEQTMLPKYSMKGLNLEVIPRKEYRLKDEIKEGTFPVLSDNAIGTNKIGNALSLLKFEEKWYLPFGDGISTEVLAKDFSEFISGSCEFRSAPSPNFITWVQTRRFFIYDLKKKTHRYYSIRSGHHGWDYVLDYAALDEQKKQYMFKIENYEAGYFLKIYDFSIDPPGESSLYDLKRGKKSWGATVLGVRDGIIFLYDYTKKKLEAINLRFEKVQHPLVDLYNSHEDVSVMYRRIKFHPTLPMALVEGRYRLYLARWGAGGSDMIPIVYLPSWSRYYDFSPDGKYAVIQFSYEDVESIAHAKEPQHVYVFRVNPDLDYVLDDPVELQSHTMLAADYLWTVNPASFVKISYKNMYRWVIDQPEEEP